MEKNQIMLECMKIAHEILKNQKILVYDKSSVTEQLSEDIFNGKVNVHGVTVNGRSILNYMDLFDKPFRQEDVVELANNLYGQVQKTTA